MKKNIKNIVSAIVATCIFTTSVAYANTTNVENVVESNAVVVKLEKQGDLLLFPVRETFEALGFEISYEPNTKTVTLAKGPMYVTFATNKDGYTFARTAPQKLGSVPVVKDGVTFVPTTLLTEIMQMEGVTVDNLTLTIANQTQEQAPAQMEDNQNVENSLNQIIITDINDDKSSITVNDPEKGEVVLNIKNSKIEFATDEKELMVGQAVEVAYGDSMTASLPPINNPESVKVVQKYSVVEVLEVNKDEKGNTSLLVKDAKLGEVVLLISDDTKIDNVKSFEKGQTLKVALSNAMTMSLPPQTVAKEISIFEKQENEQKNEEEFSQVKIVDINKENNSITVEDEKLGVVILNVKDKEILDNNSKPVAIDTLSKGQSLKVVFGQAMTRSLPPINNPIKVVTL